MIRIHPPYIGAGAFWVRVGAILNPLFPTDILGVGDGAVGAPGYGFLLDPDTGMYRVGNDHIGFTTNGVLRMGIENTNIDVDVPIYNIDGVAGAPSYTFDADTTCGLFRVGANSLGISIGGIQRWGVSLVRTISTVPFRGPNGAVGAPTYSFITNIDTGMYYSATQLNFAVDGIQSTIITNVGGGTINVDGLVLTGGSITDGSGAINFGNENLSTTGTLGCGAIGCGIAPNATTIGKFYRDDASTTAMVQIEQDGAGDASQVFIAEAHQFCIGIDNSDNTLKISPGIVHTNTDYWSMNSTGEISIGYTPSSVIKLYVRETFHDISRTMGAFVGISYCDSFGTHNNTGLLLSTRHYGTGRELGYIRGISLDATHYGTGRLAVLYASYYKYGNESTSGDTDYAHGIFIEPHMESGNITHMYDIYIRNPHIGGSVTNEWCIYSLHDAPSRFVGALQIASDANGLILGTSQDSSIIFNGTDTILDYDLLDAGTTDLRIQEHGTDRIVALTGGHVGINVTPNPANTLQVAGKVRIGDDGPNTRDFEVVHNQPGVILDMILLQNKGTTADTGTAIYFSHYNYKTARIKSWGNASLHKYGWLQLQTGDNEATQGWNTGLIIDNIGNVGINVFPSAGNKLEVAGKVRIGDAGANDYDLEVIHNQDEVTRIKVENTNNHASSQATFYSVSNNVEGVFGSYSTDISPGTELADKTIAYSTKNLMLIGEDNEVQIYVGGIDAGHRIGTWTTTGLIPGNNATIHVLAQNGAPTSTTEGALWLDTNASTNGDFMIYSNGAWRKVVSLP